MNVADTSASYKFLRATGYYLVSYRFLTVQWAIHFNYVDPTKSAASLSIVYPGLSPVALEFCVGEPLPK